MSKFKLHIKALEFKIYIEPLAEEHVVAINDIVLIENVSEDALDINLYSDSIVIFDEFTDDNLIGGFVKVAINNEIIYPMDCHLKIKWGV